MLRGREGDTGESEEEGRVWDVLWTLDTSQSG